MSTDSNSDFEMELKNVRDHPHPVAKKSTAALPTTRRQSAMVRATSSKYLRSASDRFMENFDPETSAREKRKLSRKINPPVRRPLGALYDENGVHVASGKDLCDCLNEQCEGCFFECYKCGSPKCGLECRVHRKYMVDQIEYHGYDIVKKNPLQKNAYG